MYPQPIHVISHPGSANWDVMREGDEAALSTHVNKATAERAGWEQAMDDNAALKIHNRDGSLEARLRD